jgi:hypothetical protein
VADLTDGKADQKDVHLMAIGNWANALEEQAERKKGKDADAIFQRSIDKYKEYVRKSAPRHASKILLGTHSSTPPPPIHSVYNAAPEPWCV